MKRSKLVPLVLITSALASYKALYTQGENSSHQNNVYYANAREAAIPEHWQQSFIIPAMYMAGDSSHAHHSSGSHSVHRGGFGTVHHFASS